MEELVPRDRAFDLYQRTWRRVADCLSGMTVSADTPVPHLEWTVGDLAVHLVQASEIAGELIEGKPSPYTEIENIDKVNAKLLRQRPDRHLPTLVGEFVASMEQMEERAVDMPDDFRVPFHAGLSFTPPQALAMMSTELLMHGWDLAQVTGDEWEIDPSDARLIIYTLASVMQQMVDRQAARGFTATYELRVQDGECFRMHFEEGELSVSLVDPGGPADCRMRVDPVAFLLMGYGRGSQITPILTGRLLAWGRKPWLAAKFTRLVKSP